MNYQYAEVKTENGKNKLVGLHDCSGTEKPSPVWGGNAVIPISSLAYACLSASKGSKARIQAMLENLDWLEGNES